jgi:hypothetical protein
MQNSKPVFVIEYLPCGISLPASLAKAGFHRVKILDLFRM